MRLNRGKPPPCPELSWLHVDSDRSQGWGRDMKVPVENLEDILCIVGIQELDVQNTQLSILQFTMYG